MAATHAAVPVRLARRATGALAPFLALALSACGSTGGQANYACPGYPGQPLCLPTSEIYRLTNGDAPPPAASTRATLMREEYPPAAGSGWVWSEEIYQ